MLDKKTDDIANGRQGTDSTQQENSIQRGLIEEENCMNTSTIHKAPKEKKLRLASINAVESENYEDNTKHCGSFIGKVFFGVRMTT